MRYLSVCSGIEAASVAWHELGWQPVGFAEIERFPSQVLAHRFPDVPNYGDMTKFKEWNIEPGTIDLLVGGTPCQAFSVAGLRKGLADPRGNLALTFVAMVDHYRPEWVVWENVPGVLSSNGGRDFGAFLGALGELGYGWAYRILDAQYYGVAQRRRRVFLVGHASGDPRRCAEVLFEPESLRGDPAPSREAGQKTTADPRASASGGGLWDTVGALCADTHPGAYSGQDAYTGRIIPAVHPETTSAITASMANSCLGHNKDENVIAIDALNQCLTGQVSKTIAARNDQDTASLVAQPHLYESHPNDSRVTGPVEQCPTGSARWGTGGNNTPLVTEGALPIAYDDRNQAVSTDTHHTLRGEAAGSRVSDAVVQSGEASAFTYSGYSNQPAWMTGNRTDCLSASGHSDGSHQGIGIVQSGEASAFSWQCRGDMRGMVPRPTAQLQRCQIEAVMVPEQGAVQVQWASGGGQVENPTAQALRSNAEHSYQFVRQWDASSVVAPNLTASNDPSRSPQSSEITQQVSAVVQATYPTMHVRRLTPVECERLQGFPDEWTDIKPGGKDTPDSPRYKALGNSMAVPVMRWIGMRITEASRG